MDKTCNIEELNGHCMFMHISMQMNKTSLNNYLSTVGQSLLHEDLLSPLVTGLWNSHTRITRENIPANLQCSSCDCPCFHHSSQFDNPAASPGDL